MLFSLFESLVAAIPVSFLALVTVINPLGTGFVLDAMTEGISADTRKALGRKIVVNSLGIFLVVLICGNYLLLFFGLSLPVIRVGGGLLLAVMGWKMLNATDTPKASGQVSAPDTQDLLKQSFYPYTFPVTAGPGCIAVLFTLSAHHSSSTRIETTIASLTGTFVGLIGVAIVVYLCYVYSAVIAKKLGTSGASALNRIMAFITLCIGLQIVWAGVQGLAKSL
jgi:multiple antibiotic resistance protein